MEASIYVVGLHECRPLGGQIPSAGAFVCVYAPGLLGCDGCGLWVRNPPAQPRHLAVPHSEPSRLSAVIRALTFSMNGMVLHAAVECGADNEAWWEQSTAIPK